MDSFIKKPTRKRLSELLVEAGIVKVEELPKGLEYAQKATEQDVQAVMQVKELINEQGLSVPTALRALTLSKQKRCTIEQALLELGWRPRKPEGYEDENAAAQRQIKSAFDPKVLDAIGSDKPGQQGPTYATDLQRNTWTGLKVSGRLDREAAKEFLKIDPTQEETLNDLDMPPVSPENSLLPPNMMPFAPVPAPEEMGDTGQLQALPPGFVQLMRTGDFYFAEHNYPEAEKNFLAALHILEKSNDANDLEIAELLIKLGRASLQTSDFARAEGYFVRALKIREIALGRDDISVAECLDFLAEVYDLQSQFLEAEQYYLGALGIKERVLNPDNSEVSRSLKKLVAVSKRRGGNQPEEKLSGQLLTEAGLIDPAHLEEGLNVAQERAMPVGRALISLNYLTDADLEAVLQAQLLLREGVIPAYLAVRALRLASQQRVSLEKALREIGLEPDDANNKGIFDLLRAFQELLHAERKLAPEDPSLAQLCLKVGDVFTDHHQYGQAEQLYRRALAIIERNAEDEGAQRQIAEILGRLGDLQFRQQRYDDALEIYVRLLDLWESQVGPDDINFVNCLESLAAVHYVRADYKEAGRLYQLAIAGKEKLLGSEHPAVASAVQGRANCYFGVKRFPEAEQLYRRAMMMYEKVYGPNNEQVAILLNVLGDLFYTQGDFAKAQTEYARGLTSFSKCANPDVWAFAGMLEKIAHCFCELGDLERADSYYRHFIKTREGFGTATSPDMPDALERYALVLDRLNRPEEAATVRQHAESTRHMLSQQSAH